MLQHSSPSDSTIFCITIKSRVALVGASTSRNSPASNATSPPKQTLPVKDEVKEQATY